jgi:hypothetical protein
VTRKRLDGEAVDARLFSRVKLPDPGDAVLLDVGAPPVVRRLDHAAELLDPLGRPDRLHLVAALPELRERLHRREVRPLRGEHLLGEQRTLRSREQPLDLLAGL